MKKISLFALVLVFTALSFQEAYAQRTVRMNLERMISEADIIIHGTVSAVRTETDPETNILATFISIDIIESFYGTAGSQITVKMLAARTKSGARKFTEIPHFSVGEEIISMFYAPSEIGFSSPVGLGQGKFTVVTEAKTKQRIVRNGFNNSQLFSDLKHTSALAKSTWQTDPKQSIEVSDFITTIRSLVTAIKK